MNSTPARFSTASITARDVSSPAYFPVSILVIVFRCSRVASAKSRSGRLWPTDSAASCSDETAWWRTEELMRLVSRGVRVPSAVKMKWRVSFPYRDG